MALAARFIKEVYHPDLLANPVLVRKKNNEWRMCVNYTDLNKHCPDVNYSLFSTATLVIILKRGQPD